jgi:hypothetical protein
MSQTSMITKSRSPLNDVDLKHYGIVIFTAISCTAYVIRLVFLESQSVASAPRARGLRVGNRVLCLEGAARKQGVVTGEESETNGLPMDA